MVGKNTRGASTASAFAAVEKLSLDFEKAHLDRSR
jgi:hypothetical protein